jgi:hypothetical protein
VLIGADFAQRVDEKKRYIKASLSTLCEGGLEFELISVQRSALSGGVDSSVSGTERILPNDSVYLVFGIQFDKVWRWDLMSGSVQRCERWTLEMAKQTGLLFWL